MQEAPFTTSGSNVIVTPAPVTLVQTSQTTLLFFAVLAGLLAVTGSLVTFYHEKGVWVLIAAELFTFGALAVYGVLYHSVNNQMPLLDGLPFNAVTFLGPGLSMPFLPHPLLN